MVIWKMPDKYSHARYRFWEFDCHVFVKTCRDHSLAQGSKHMFLSCLLIQQPIRGEHPQNFFEEWNILPTLLRRRLWFSFWKNNRSKNKTTRVVDYKMTPQLSWTTCCGDVSQPTISEPKASDFAQMAQVIGWLLQSVIDPSVLHARNEAGLFGTCYMSLSCHFPTLLPPLPPLSNRRRGVEGKRGGMISKHTSDPANRLGPC